MWGNRILILLWYRVLGSLQHMDLFDISEQKIVQGKVKYMVNYLQRKKCCTWSIVCVMTGEKRGSLFVTFEELLVCGA